LQNRSAELVDDPQPTGGRAIGQGHLLGGVHLPDLVDAPGTIH